MKIKKNEQMFYHLAKEIMNCRSTYEFEIMRLAVKECPHISIIDKLWLYSYLHERKEKLTK